MPRKNAPKPDRADRAQHPLLHTFDRIDRALVAADFPATSPWWRAQLERFVSSGRGRWVVRAGRRAGKSSTMCRLAVAKAMADDWKIPPGDRGVVAFVSVNRKEASDRLHTIGKILAALRIAYDERGEEITLRDRPVVFRVITGTITGVVGFTSIAIFADEMARWANDSDGANPAREVMGSLRPTKATIPTAIECCVSSPWGLDDYHHELVELGEESGAQVVSVGATWECNPTITEEWTRRDQPDERTWSREYAGIPGDTVSSAFDPAHVLAAFERFEPEALPVGECVVVIDPSRMRHDTFAIGVVGPTDTGGLTMVHVQGVKPPSTTLDAVNTLAGICQRYGVTRVFSDPYDSGGLGALLEMRGLTLHALPWTGPSKHAAGAWVQRMLSEGALTLCPHDGLRKQLLDQRAILRPNERIEYPTNGRDYASLLFCLAHAIVEGHVSIEALGSSSYLSGFGAGAGEAFGLSLGFGGLRDHGNTICRIEDGHALGGLSALLGTPHQVRAVQLDNAARSQIAAYQAEAEVAAVARVAEWGARERSGLE